MGEVCIYMNEDDKCVVWDYVYRVMGPRVKITCPKKRLAQASKIEHSKSNGGNRDRKGIRQAVSQA